MPCLGLADVAERAHLAEVGNHLVVGGPGLVLVVERLVQHPDIRFAQSIHVDYLQYRLNTEPHIRHAMPR
ncbi:hypothetical protein D3C78_1679540 [compost metagenome]